MTDQHPLTDETCEDLSSCITILTAPGDPDPYICPQYIADDMRAAADWQLEQVIEWIKGKEYDQYHFDEIIYAEDLRKAMRPQQQQENN